jgi:hypothetical protein
VLDSVLRPIAGVELPNRLSPVGQGDYSFDAELNALRKHVLSFEAPFASHPCNL